MYGKYFTYDNEASTDYGLMIGGFEIDNDIPFAMNRELLKGSLNRYRNRVNHMGTQWSDVLEFTISFIKDTCQNTTQSSMVFTEDEVNDINAWLTSPDYPILFHMYDFDFERDSSDNLLLIDNSSDSKTFDLNVDAPGYKLISYGVEDGIINYIQVEEREGGTKIAPIPQLTFYNGYISFSAEDNDFIKNIASISVDGVTYSKVKARDWLSTYGVGQSYRNSYMILINKSLVLNQKYDYFGLFSNVEAQVLDGEVVGFTATFTTDSPFAWTQEITQTFNCSDGDTITFDVNSAEKYREVYPVITIKPPRVEGEVSTEIKLKNNTDEKELTLQLRPADTTVIDCRHCKISHHSETISFEDLGITDVDYIYWPRLYNGTNSFTVTGDCELTFTYREPRKVGAY